MHACRKLTFVLVTYLSACNIMAYYLLERRKAAVVHIRRRYRDISQGRHSKLPDITGTL